MLRRVEQQVSCKSWSHCDGGHLFESCFVEGGVHTTSGHLKPDQALPIRPGSDVDWTKRTFERFSLLVEPSKLLFYGSPTEEQMQYHDSSWPPPTLTDHLYIRHPPSDS